MLPGIMHAPPTPGGAARCSSALPASNRTRATNAALLRLRRAVSRPAAQVFASEAPDSAAPGTRQTYIQESLNFTGAELAARISGMQAAMRAKLAAAAAAAEAAAGSRSSTPSRARQPEDVSGSPAWLNASSQLAESDVALADAPQLPSELDLPREQDMQLELPPLPPLPPPPPPLPSASNLAEMSPSEKLQALQQVQQTANRARQAASSPSSPYYANAPKTIDIRMYDQLVVAHNKLSGRLSESNAHICTLEEQINRNQEDLIAAFELLKQIAMEFGTTSRLAQSTAAAVMFGVEPQDALDKITKLQERLATLEQAVLEQRKEFGLRVVRKVPVEWIGVASEVRVMGDFDDWTRGHELSAEDVTSDTVFSRFEGTLMLRPGSYRVKFLVDNEWRLAADWPTEDDGKGNTVNVLTVA